MTATTTETRAQMNQRSFARRPLTPVCIVTIIAAQLVSSATSVRAQTHPDLSSCRAGHLTPYVGRPYRVLQKIRPDARYVCSTCPMTMDFRADRLTVTYDVRTKRIRTLRCV